MRIAIDCRKIADFGIGTYVRGLITHLAEASGSHEYVAIVSSRADKLVPPSMRKVIVDAPPNRVCELVVVALALRRARVDLYHAPHINVPFTDVPTVVTIHDVIPLRTLPSWHPARWYASVMGRRAARTSRAVITVSEASKAAIVQTLRCPAEKIVVIPNGVDERFFEPASTRFGDYVLYAGNDKPHKNVGGLVAAFDIVRRTHPSLSLVLAGAPFEQYRGLVGVDCVGFVSDAQVLELYRGARAFILPSFEEGFGLPAIEAMACGTPVITSATPAMLEITGDAALHVDPSRVEAIAEAIGRVIDDDALSARLREAGPLQARKYSWKRTADLTQKVYDDVYRQSSR